MREILGILIISRGKEKRDGGLYTDKAKTLIFEGGGMLSLSQTRSEAQLSRVYIVSECGTEKKKGGGRDPFLGGYEDTCGFCS